MSMLQEFKTFAMKGNVIDLAVGVIIGGAFAKITDSLVKDLVMPVVSTMFNGLNFSRYYIPLNGQEYGLPLAEAQAGGAVLAYGSFITVALNFVILAFIIFQMIRTINRVRRKEDPTPEKAAPVTPEDIVLLREIRDALQKERPTA
jgi:large conductance mechanosensitive channel